MKNPIYVYHYFFPITDARSFPMEIFKGDQVAHARKMTHTGLGEEYVKSVEELVGRSRFMVLDPLKRKENPDRSKADNWLSPWLVYTHVLGWISFPLSNPEDEELWGRNDEARNVAELARGIAGFIKGTGKAPSRFVIQNTPFTEKKRDAWADISQLDNSDGGLNNMAFPLKPREYSHLGELMLKHFPEEKPVISTDPVR